MSKASIKGHPIHPMLIVFPVGLWIFSLVCDIVYAFNGNLVWSVVAYYCIGGGIVGALLAAIPGSIDLFSTKNSHVRKIGYIHMGINLTVAALFIINFAWRTATVLPAVGPFVLSIVSIAALGVSGWLGWEMVYRHGMGMERPAGRAEETEEAPRLRRVA